MFQNGPYIWVLRFEYEEQIHVVVASTIDSAEEEYSRLQQKMGKVAPNGKRYQYEGGFLITSESLKDPEVGAAYSRWMDNCFLDEV